MLKSLSRHRLFTVINILGFSLSLTLVILLGAYTWHELTIDAFQQKKERIYLYSTIEHPYSPPALAPEIQSRYPDVEAFTRLFAQDMILSHQNIKYRTSIMTVDTTFFDIFSFPLLLGNRSLVLKGDRNEVVISESYARKVFGEENPIGKILSYKYSEKDEQGEIHELNYSFIVGGVMADMENTLLKSHDILVSINTAGDIYGSWLNKGWESGNHLSVFLMKGDKDPNEYHDDLLAHFRKIFWTFRDDKEADIIFTPLAKAYFNPIVSSHLTTRGSGSLTHIITLSGVAVLILIFAVINYINLTLAQSSNRARELATRRLLGSPRSHLFWKLIVESVLLCMISFGIALILALFMAPFFKNLMGLTDPLFSNLSASVYIGIISGVLFIGVISGLFPAFVITNFTPLDVVRGTFIRKTRQVYSKILIGFQYAITLLLLICSYVVFAQTAFLRNTEKGFNNQNLIYFSQENGFMPTPMVEEILKIPGVKSISKLQGSVIDGGNNRTFKYTDGNLISMQQFNADTTVFDVMKYEIITRFDSDTLKRTGDWINETLYKRLDLPPGENVFYLFKGQEWEVKVELAGVIRDFSFARPENTPVLLSVYQDIKSPWSYMLRYDGRDGDQVMDQVKATFSRVSNGIPFNGGFVDAKMNSWYDTQERSGKTVALLAFIAIVIATLGMLAMASYFIQQRENEIAIRKAYGSRNGELMLQLQKHFILLIGIAFVIAAPLAFWVSRLWLSDFNQQIPLTPVYFILPLAGILLMAINIVYHLSRRAVNANPAETLRR